MIHKKITLFIAAFALLLVARAQHGEESKVDKALQKQEVKRMVKDLKNDNTLSQHKLTEAKTQTTDDFSMISYRVMGRTRIQFSGGEWIYFLAHSSHENPAVGDVCVAITDKGKMFVNYGHICGGDMVHYICKNCQMPANAGEFFKHFVSDVEETGWVKWK